MIIYFAGVPAGNQAKRELHLRRIAVQNRLVAFYYFRQMEITMKQYKGTGKVVNCKKQRYDVYIGREGQSSLHNYGNPFIVGQHGSRSVCVRKHWQWLAKGKFPHIEPERRKWILENISSLRGKTLGCFCSRPPCHGYNLLELAERAKG